MKIALIVRTMHIPGGVERQAVMLAKTLTTLGHQVTLYTTVFDRSTCFPNETVGLTIRALDADVFSKWESERKGKRGLSFMAHEDRLAQYLAHMIDGDTEVLNPNDNWGSHVAHHFKKRNSQAVSVLMLSDLDTARWTLFDSDLFGRKKNLLKWPLYWLKDMYERFYLKSQDAIVVLNNRTVALVKKYLRRDAVVVRSGIDTDLFLYTPHVLPVSGQPIRLLSHGIFYIHRRYEDTLRALALLRSRGLHVTLDIIGDFNARQGFREYHQKMLALVDELKLGQYVRFLGRVSDEKLIEMYQQSHLFVSAAHMQTWGLAVFEALSSGLPAAISNTIGATEVLEHNKTAQIFEAGNPDKQAECIYRLVTNPELYAKISTAGSDFVHKNMSREKYGEAMANIFKDTCIQHQI